MIFTSNDGNGHLVKLPRASRYVIADAFEQCADTFAGVIRHGLDRGPASGSPAAEYVAEENGRTLSTSETVGSSVVENILFSCRAGIDHARMVATALRDERAAFGVVTLTRGCIESFGKAWWIGADGRKRYALLSAVAHGESLGISDFIGVTTGTRSRHYVIGLPAWLAEYCVEMTFIAESHAMRRLIEFIGYADDSGSAANSHDVALRIMQSERFANAPFVHRSLHRFER